MYCDRTCDARRCFTIGLFKLTDHRDRFCGSRTIPHDRIWRFVEGKHCGRFRELRSVIAVAFASSQNHCDRFCDSREVLRVLLLRAHSIVMVTLQTREKHRNRIGRSAEVITVAFHEVVDTLRALFARSREREHGSSREWSFTSELTLSRQRQKERDFRVILRVS